MSVQYLEREGKPKLAYILTPSSREGSHLPLIMFLGGYRSDMTGTKAIYIEQQCRQRGQAFVRFDYSGHGQSDGCFEDGTIGRWLDDALDILDHVVHGSVILVGSSMGGWISLLVAQAREEIVHGLIGIAAAPDFTEDIYARLSDKQKQELHEDGLALVPNDYSDEPYAFTKSFYEEAKAHLLLGHKRHVAFPMCLIQGRKDKDVPWQMVTKIQSTYEAPSFDIVIIEEGDHRLSAPEQLEIIGQEIKTMLQKS